MEAAFERLQQELRGQRDLLLARLSELEQRIRKERDKYISTVTEEITRLGAQVEELEEKCQQPASELLQVRVAQHLAEQERGSARRALCCRREGAGRGRRGEWRLWLRATHTHTHTPHDDWWLSGSLPPEELPRRRPQKADRLTQAPSSCQGLWSQTALGLSVGSSTLASLVTSVNVEIRTAPPS